MKEVPIFGQGVWSDSAFITRQRRLNCFYDIRTDQDKHTTVVRATPGSVIQKLLPTAPIRGYRVVSGVLYVVAGNTLYSVSSTFVVSTLGTMTTNTGLVGMTDNAVQLLVVDGVAGYCYTIVTGSYAQSGLNAAGSFGAITDGNYPTSATTCAFLSGRVVVNKLNTRQFYCSEQYDITNWTNSASAATYGTKNDFSDNLVAVDVLNGMLIMWGAASIEFWQDVSTAPLPFARVLGATQSCGLAATNSRAPFNNTFAFVGRTQDGGTQVFALEGYVPKRISNADIEDLFTSFSTATDGIGLTYTSHGHPRYQVTFPTAGRTIVYDGLTTFWDEAQTGLSLRARHFANIGIAFNGVNYVSDNSTGNIYKLSDTVYTDNGTQIKRQVTTRHVHAAGNQLSIDELFIDMATGIGLQSGQGSAPQIMLQVSRDNGNTFGVEKWTSIGAVGNYKTRAIWRRLGSAEDFVFQLTMTDPVFFAIIHGAVVSESPEMQYG